MPIVQRFAYFDHASVSPLPEPTRKRIVDFVNESSEIGNTIWPQWKQELERARDTAANMINADRGEIALVGSTTIGLNLLAESFPFEPGDNVVIPEDEFPSNVFPWLNLKSKGVEIRQVPADHGRIDMAAFEAACDARTKVVSVSWIAYASGYMRDLVAIEKIVHKHDTVFMVDAIQGLGIFPMDVKALNIDCLAADGHKWMLGPEGAAMAYYSEKLLEKMEPRLVGWHSVKHAGNFGNLNPDWKTTADRYEGGSPNLLGMLGFGVSLNLLCDLGAENIGNAILDITDIACEKLQSAGADIFTLRDKPIRSGIVIFEMPGKDSNALHGHLLKCGVALTSRFDKLRISPHAYNTEEDLDRLIDGLKSFKS